MTKYVTLFLLLVATPVLAMGVPNYSSLSITKTCWRITDGSAVYRMNQCVSDNKEALLALRDPQQYPDKYQYVYQACYKGLIVEGWHSVKYCVDYNLRRA